MGLTMWDVWERAETGPICPMKEFDVNVYFRKVQELVKKYDIKYDSESPVPTDDTLIESAWQAGFELLVEIGALCIDTERLIKFEEEEVREALRLTPREMTLGQGKNAVTVVKRNIEDKRLPLILDGLIGTPVSEDIAMKAYEAYAREPSLNALLPGTLTEIHGVLVKGGSPQEMCVEKMHVAMMREAARRAGRPGLCIAGTTSQSAAAFAGASDPEWGWRSGDMAIPQIIANMKVDYNNLGIAQHAHHCGMYVIGGDSPGIGGFSGGPEGSAIGAVAGALLTLVAYQGEMPYAGGIEVARAGLLGTRKCIFSSALSTAAIARHSGLLHWSPNSCYAYAGPSTEMYLYEIAATLIPIVVCGSDLVIGTTGRCGIETDYFGGPLATRFTREIAYAGTKLSRGDANEVVKALLAKFEDRYKTKKPEMGKKFQECYDLKTLKPTKQYLDLYDRVKKELEGLGLHFK